MKEGLHILELLKPTQDLNADANHGMLKDFQDKVLLFPMVNVIELEKNIILDNENDVKFDTYEDLVNEIEELKSEITTIIVTPSSTLGKETFDTPSVKGEGDKKGHLRKDRYSALLYANFYCRNKSKNEVLKVEYRAVGGTKETQKNIKVDAQAGMYYGPGLLKFAGKKNSAWFTGGTARHVKHNR